MSTKKSGKWETGKVEINDWLAEKAVKKLEAEAARFTGIAMCLSLELLKNPFAPDVEKKKRLAQDHLIRRETFKDAARIVAQEAA